MFNDQIKIHFLVRSTCDLKHAIKKTFLFFFIILRELQRDSAMSAKRIRFQHSPTDSEFKLVLIQFTKEVRLFIV